MGGNSRDGKSQTDITGLHARKEITKRFFPSWCVRRVKCVERNESWAALSSVPYFGASLFVEFVTTQHNSFFKTNFTSYSLRHHRVSYAYCTALNLYARMRSLYFSIRISTIPGKILHDSF